MKRIHEGSGLPWFARLLLVDVASVEAGLARLRESDAFCSVPNAWQVALGVARMWRRVLLRSETIGLSRGRVRDTWRARLLRGRLARFPFLVAERAIAPLDFSGLISGRERILRHLLGAHHEGDQFVYDLELLRVHPGALEELRVRAQAVVDGTDPRAGYLRDLVVFEAYHEALLAAAERALEGDFGIAEADRDDPDISLTAYLAWCSKQPPSWERSRDELVVEVATALDRIARSMLRGSASPKGIA